MQILSTQAELLAALKPLRERGLRIGFVPTMGALHAGHASLVKRSVADNDVTLASVFVNPTQFGKNEDLDKYPRTLEADAELLKKEKVDLLFAPEISTIYPEQEFELFFGLKTLDKVLEGEKRPGHFQGVMLVVCKLFNLVQPHRAYFGQKDFQQLAVIRTMTRELFFPIEVIGCPTIREADGLAMSSRNRYLSSEQRKQALFLSSTLNGIREMASKNPKVSDLLSWAHLELKKYPGVRLEYIEIRNGTTLAPIEEVMPANQPVALVAAFVGQTRLIDNMSLIS